VTPGAAARPPASAELGDVARLGQLLTVLLSEQDSDQLLDDVLWRLCELFQADITTLADVDRGSSAVRVLASIGLPEDAATLPPGVEVARSAVRTGAVQHFPAATGVVAADPTGVRRGVSIPLPGGRLVLSLHRCADVDFTSRDVELLTVMARHLEAVLEQGRRVRQLTVLAGHGREVDQLTDAEAISAAAVDALPRLLDVDAAAVMRLRAGLASYVAQAGLDVAVTSGWSCPVEDLAAYEAVRTRRPVAGDDLRTLSRHPDASSWQLSAFTAAPLVVAGRVDALLYAFRRTGAAFTTDEISVISLLASQTAAALERVATLHAADDRRRKAELVRDIGRGLAASLHEGSVLERFGAALLEVTHSDRVTVLLLDEDAVALRVAASTGADSDGFARRLAALLAVTPAGRTGVVWDALATRRATSLDVSAAPASPLLQRYTSMSRARELLVQPLVVNDQPLGVVLLEQLAGHLEQDERDSVEQLATVAAVALHNAQLYQRVEADRAQLRALHDLTLAIGACDDLDSTLQQITDAAARLTGAERCRLGLRESAQTYRLAAVTGDTDRPGATYGLDSGVGGWITQTGEAIWTSDLEDVTSLPPEALRQARRPEGSAAGVPLRGADGEVRGFLSLHHARPGQFRRDVLALLERFGAEAVLAVDSSTELSARRRLESRLREQAERDPLTGLANRTVLLDRLGAALTGEQRGGDVAVLYLDLDRFKSVNDSLGHAGGDELLVGVARRLSGLVRCADLVARLGGDEFVVLVDEISEPAEAARLAERMLAALAQPLTVAGTQVVIGASIGVATVRGAGQHPTSVLQDADIAMYQAKRAGKDRYVVFQPSMRAAAVSRLPVESELREAVADGALTVHYQPVVDLRTHAVVGVEALVRWPHPVRGLVPPDEFIPIAEETGLIARIDEFVLRTAAEQVRAWQGLPGHERLRLNVNVSALSLHDPALQEQIAAVLAESGLAPASLVVELTESAAMRDPERSLELFHRIRELGARVALDDFGTGYSNIAHLSRLPFDVLKIDRGLVRLLDGGESGEALVRTVLALAAALGLQVTAEGVETVEQAGWLQELGCHHGQGYHYSRPLPPDELGALLSAAGEAGSPVATLPPPRLHRELAPSERSVRLAAVGGGTAGSRPATGH
jgi:diguanylate cyclase (GGDEF)-like protein